MEKTIRDIAMEALGGSEVMKGKDKMAMEQLKDMEVSISAVDVLTDEDGKPYIVFTTVEYPDNYTFGGKIMSDMFLDIIEKVGDVEATNAELAAEPLTVRFGTQMTKKTKRGYTTVEVV